MLRTEARLQRAPEGRGRTRKLCTCARRWLRPRPLKQSWRRWKLDILPKPRGHDRSKQTMRIRPGAGGKGCCHLRSCSFRRPLSPERYRSIEHQCCPRGFTAINLPTREWFSTAGPKGRGVLGSFRGTVQVQSFRVALWCCHNHKRLQSTLAQSVE